MKKRQVGNRIKVGIFSVIALVLVTTLVFYIGSNQQRFGKKKTIISIFKDVGGLKSGNMVRFNGVIIGVVKEVTIISDSTVKVLMEIDKEQMWLIKSDSKAVISTEGLLGSKYVRIFSGSPDAAAINNGGTIKGQEPYDFDELLSSLNKTGVNAENITKSIDGIMNKINRGEGTLGALVSDSGLNNKFHQMVTSFSNTGIKTNELTAKMIDVADTLKAAGKNTVEASENFAEFSRKLNNDSSTLGRFISDTIMANQINTTLVKVETTVDDVQETSESVRSSWLMKLFSKKNKKQ